MRTALYTRKSAILGGWLIAAIAGLSPAPAQESPSPTSSQKYPLAESFAGNFLAGLVAGSARDTAAASIYLREALKADPRNFHLMALAFESHLANGNMDEALRLAQRLFNRDNRNAVARLVLGLRSFKEGKFAEARSRIVTSGKRPDSDITGSLLRAWATAGAREFDAALKMVDEIGGDASLSSFRDYHAGLIADLANRTEEAIRRLKSAYSASPRPPVRLVEAYGSLLARSGKLEEAKKVFADFESRIARHPLVAHLSKLLAEGKPLPRMIATAQQGAAEVLFGLGVETARNVGSARGRQDEELTAIVYLRLARYLDPSHEYAQITLGDVYERLKRHENAIEVYREVSATSPLADSARVQTALNLSALKRDEEAIAILRDIVARKPSDLEAFTALGNILRIRRRYEEAVEVYTKGLEALGKVEPSHWSIYYFRGSAYERSKQWPKAEADFKKALELQPDNAQVLNYLGYSWVDQNMNLDEGFEMLKKAVSLAPRDGHIVDSLGWAYYRLGKFEDAVRELERATLLSPSDSTINDHLGDALWRVGRKLEAKFQWNHARDILLRKQADEGLDDFDKEELEKVLMKLQNGLPDDVKAEPAKPTTDGG